MSEYKKIKIIGDCSLQMAIFISAKKMKGISILLLLTVTHDTLPKRKTERPKRIGLG